MTRIHVNTIAVTVLLLGLLAGCGPSDAAPPTAASGSSTTPATTESATPAPSTTAARSDPTSRPSVTVSRTGGIAGVNQTIVITADGRWTYTDRRTSATQTGQFTADLYAQLVRLAADPRVAQELLQSGTGVCSDGFHYTLTIESRSATFEDCGQDRPTVKSLLLLVVENTAF